MKVLIIGLGRAGKRHMKAMKDRGCKTVTVDTNGDTGADFNVLSTAMLAHRDISYAIVATPPQWHLEHIQQCQRAGLPVLCEKPLCGTNYDEAMIRKSVDSHNLMFAYNWRWNPVFDSEPLPYGEDERFIWWQTYSTQYRREVPQWGTLMDHVAHDVDTLMFLSRCEKFYVDAAHHCQWLNMDSWHCTGTLEVDGDEQGWSIVDQVSGTFVPRSGLTGTPQGYYSPQPNPMMFTRMYESYERFIRGRESGARLPTLESAIKVHNTLRDIEKVASQCP